MTLNITVFVSFLKLEKCKGNIPDYQGSVPFDYLWGKTPSQIANPYNSPHYRGFLTTTVGSRIMDDLRFSTSSRKKPWGCWAFSQGNGDFQIHFQKCLAHPLSGVGTSQDTAPGCQCWLRTVDLWASPGTGVRWLRLNTFSPSSLPSLGYLWLNNFMPSTGVRIHTGENGTDPSTLACSYWSVTS